MGLWWFRWRNTGTDSQSAGTRMRHEVTGGVMRSMEVYGQQRAQQGSKEGPWGQKKV